MKHHFAHFLFSAAVLSAPAYAQSVEIGELDAASAYDAPIVGGDAGLDAALWQGTSAKMAAALISKAPISDSHALVQDLIKAAIFSGGVPPEGEEADKLAYKAARLTAATALGQDASVAKFVKNDRDLAVDPGVNADIALAAGNTKEACHISDGVTDGRSEARWKRLRAFCHVVREEIAAAELTTELLKTSGFEDPLYFDLMDVLTGRKKTAKITEMGDDPLYAAMAGLANVKLSTSATPPSMSASTALNSNVPAAERLNALYRAASVLSDDQIAEILTALGTADEADGEPESYDIESAMKAPPAKGTAQLYALMKSASGDATKAMAAAELLLRADTSGAFSRFAAFLTPDISALSAAAQAEASPIIFARAATQRGDLGALQSLYQATGETPDVQARIALASDAIGNGFTFGPLGQDIEGRMAEPGTRARGARDAVIALALGAQLSETAADAMDSLGKGSGRSLKTGPRLALGAVAKDGSRAETALRAAIVLQNGGPAALDNDALYAVISALNAAGLTDFAGRAAAEDFLSGAAEMELRR